MVEISWRMSTACWAAACLSVSGIVSVVAGVLEVEDGGGRGSMVVGL